MHPTSRATLRRGLAVFGLALSPLLLGAYPAGYQYPDNWELRTHANGEYYYLYVPDGRVEGQTYPLVLALHGCCWDGVRPEGPGPDPILAAFHHWEENVQAEPTFIVQPFSASRWLNKGDRILTIVHDLQAEFPVDAQRLILTGFSMGGAGAIEFLNEYPDTFAGALTVAVALNGTSSLVAERFRDVPIWGAAGTNDGWKTNNDTVFGFIRQANGFANDPAPGSYGLFPRYTIFEGAGHGDAMEAFFGEPEVLAWAYTLRRDGNATPQVRFVDPTPAGSVLLPAGTTVVTLAAEAIDRDGEIRQVEFRVDGQVVALLTAPPYTVTTSALSPGDHLVQVLVTDNGQARGFAMDKHNEDRRTLWIPGTLTVATPELPPARAGEFYRMPLVAEGSNGTTVWTVLSSTKLPKGLALRTNGHLEGVVYEPGEYTFTVRVNDAKKVQVPRAFTLQVRPARPHQPLFPTLAAKNPKATFQPWAFGDQEPYRTAGYGLPGGSYKRQWHPYFDGLRHTGNIPGAVFQRVYDNGVAIPSTDADWIRLQTDIPVRLHVAYPRTSTGAVPAWLAEGGFQASGQVFEAYTVDFLDYVKDFPAGEIVLGPNQGDITGATHHYLLVSEPVPGTTAEYPWPVEGWTGAAQDLVETWMGRLAVYRGSYPWVWQEDHGWLFLVGENPSSLWWFTPPDRFWWTGAEVYPWIYRWPDGWLYHLPGTRQPAWYYLVAQARWAYANTLAELDFAAPEAPGHP